MTPRQLQAHLAEHPQCILLDVREEWEFAHCHLRDSLLIPMGQIQSQLDELDKDAETILICHHGIRSRQVAYYLEHMGFTNVVNLEGGVERWADEVEPDMPRY